MSEFSYVVVGGGMTANAAAHGIRSVDRTGSIAVLTAEPEGPYARPPLSKGLWSSGDEASLGLPAADGVTLRTGVRVVAIDRGAHRVTLADGGAVRYERLLLATGGTPRRLPFGGDAVVYFRTVADYRRLRALPAGTHVVVVGGGFIGSELAAALTGAGHRVTLVFPEAGIGARLFPAELAGHLNAFYASKGVEVRPGELVTGIEAKGDGAVLRTGRGELAAGAVVAGLGLVPNDAIAKEAGLAVNDGILVDEALRTSDPDVFAAGDVARFPSVTLGKRIRVEHEDHANVSGREAGRAMAGAEVAYRHLPFFYSDLFELGYEAVGELDPRLETFADWKDRFRTGSVYYLAEGRVRGVLNWGVFGQVDAARALLAEPGPHDARTLVGRIPA